MAEPASMTSDAKADETNELLQEVVALFSAKDDVSAAAELEGSSMGGNTIRKQWKRHVKPRPVIANVERAL